MGMDDLRRLVANRNLTDGFQQTPLQEFVGVFEDFEAKTNDRFSTESKVSVDVVLKFTDLEVICSREPYNFPIAQIPFKHNQSAQSKWGIFYKSLLKFLPEDATLEEAKGHKLHIGTESHSLYQGRERGTQPTDCLVVLSVDGASVEVSAGTGHASSSAKVVESSVVAAVKLLDGKSEAEFNQAALRSDVVKKDSGLVNQIVSRTFIKTLEETSVVVKGEDGKYHLTANGLSIAAMIGS